MWEGILTIAAKDALGGMAWESVLEYSYCGSVGMNVNCYVK